MANDRNGHSLQCITTSSKNVFFENSEYASWKRDDIDKLERTGVETVFVIEVEKQNQEVDLYYSADGTLIKSIVDTDDDNSEHLPVQLTEAMKNFINEKYPNARIMEVDVEDDRNDWDFGFTEVDIIHNGISKDVLFNQTGNWYSTSWEIRQNELPEAVNNTISIINMENIVLTKRSILKKQMVAYIIELNLRRGM